ncbi:VOC family protein [Dactylosporangium darangshiense]|uniref:hypothetical protein n=1 Tax=Dactylosporangium darangshiense TaxID=579108 RepID=UPI0036304594
MTVISLMLAVPDAAAASAWYQRALGATELWNLGSVIGLQIHGAPFFLAEPANNRWESPDVLGSTTVRIEVFVDDPDTFAAAAAAAEPSITIPCATTRCRGVRIDRAASSTRSVTSGSSATDPRCSVIETLRHGSERHDSGVVGP